MLEARLLVKEARAVINEAMNAHVKTKDTRVLTVTAHVFRVLKESAYDLSGPHLSRMLSPRLAVHDPISAAARPPTQFHLAQAWPKHSFTRLMHGPNTVSPGSGLAWSSPQPDPSILVKRAMSSAAPRTRK